MKKRVIRIVGIILFIILGIYLGFLFYKDYQIRHAKIEVILKEDLSMEFGE